MKPTAAVKQGNAQLEESERVFFPSHEKSDVFATSSVFLHFESHIRHRPQAGLLSAVFSFQNIKPHWIH